MHHHQAYKNSPELSHNPSLSVSPGGKPGAPSAFPSAVPRSPKKPAGGLGGLGAGGMKRTGPGLEVTPARNADAMKVSIISF